MQSSLKDNVSHNVSTLGCIAVVTVVKVFNIILFDNHHDTLQIFFLFVIDIVIHSIFWLFVQLTCCFTKITAVPAAAHTHIHTQLVAFPDGTD